MDCGFQGNNDVFGLGIRLGYYAQLLAVTFSNYFAVSEAKALRVVNLVFLLALIVAGFTYCAKASQTYAIEAYLLLQIGIVTGLVGITDRSRYVTKYRAVSQERLAFRICVMAFGTLFNIIFWWKGLNTMLPTPCNGSAEKSKTYAFFLSRVLLYGWFHTFMKTFSILAAIFAAYKHISDDLGVLIYERRIREHRRSFAAYMQHDLQTVSTNGEVKRARVNTSQALSSQRQPKVKPQSLQASTFGTPDIFRGVTKAERYLEDIYSIFPVVHSASFGPPSSRLEQIPSPRRYICTHKTTYFRCLHRLAVSSLTNSPSIDMQNTLYYHFIAVGTLPAQHWPRLVTRMYELDNSRNGATPTWQHFKLASDIQLAQIPSTQTMSIWMAQAIVQVAFVILLILQVEFTITWNNVDGLYSLSSLGQLIPFITGVGGLLKVFWVWLRAFWIKEDAGLEGSVEPRSAYETVIANYVDSRGMTAVSKPARVNTA